MLSELCVRPRHWQLTSLSLSYAHGSAYDRTPAQPFPDRIDHSINTHPHRCGASSVWHAIIPSVWRQRRRRTVAFDGYENEALRRCEGSWNVAWDARPARWLHHPDLVWLIFGICTGLATPLPDSTADSDSISDFDDDVVVSDTPECGRSNYRVTGVAADGRCLFRAIAHMSCLIDGEKIPDENRQTELADELRAQVVEELLKRRKEVQWFIEEDFDVYVKRIQQPYVWGGEPELLMSSHVLGQGALMLEDILPHGQSHGSPFRSSWRRNVLVTRSKSQIMVNNIRKMRKNPSMFCFMAMVIMIYWRPYPFQDRRRRRNTAMLGT